MRFLRATVGPFARLVEPVTLDLQQRGIVLVEGENRDSTGALDSNGAGKSMLFEAIFAWCPFNKLIRTGNDVVGADLVTWNGHAANVLDEIETTTGRFALHRRRSPRGSPTFTILGVDGAPLRGQTADTQHSDGDVAQLLGFDYTTLRSALFLHGEALGVSTYAKEMAIIESILRFDDYTKAAKIATTRGTEADRQHRALVSELERISLQIEQSRGTLDDLRGLDESTREQQLRETIRHTALLIAERDAREQAKELASVEHAEASRLVRIAQRHADVQRADVERLEGLSQVQQCPTCGSDVALGKHVLRDARGRLAALEHDLTAAQEMDAAKRLDAINASSRMQQAIEAQHEHDDATEQLTALLHRKEQRERMIESHTARLVTLEHRVAQLTDEIAAARRVHHDAQKWTRERGFEELKAIDLSRGVPVLNAAAEHYSQMLSDGAVRVAFVPQRESRGEGLVQISGETGPTYESLSSGERRRANIIITLSRRALARWRMRDAINVAVWDEVFDTLDESGLRRMAAVLQEDLQETDTIFVVTHHPRLREMFPQAQTIRVIREGGVSRVVDEG